MNFGDRISVFLHSARWKKTQNYIYSWGASVVLIGALFKLEHLAYASVFLGVGLSIEALIFFVSAFEPIMDPPDWKVVYPQLRMGDEENKDLEKYAKIDEKYKSFFGGGGGGSVSLGDIPKEQLDGLKASFEKLSKTANGLKDISESTVATESFIKNLNNASQSIETVVDANKNVSTVMEDTVQEISKSYKSAAQQIKTSAETSASGINQSLNELSGSVSGVATSFDKTINEFNLSSVKLAKHMENTGAEFTKQLNSSAKELNSSYQEMTNSMTNGFKGFEKSSQNYTSNLDKLNRNLTSINTAYELHLKGTNDVEKMVKEYSKGVGEIGKLLNSSVKETEQFNEKTKELNQNIHDLNDVYGRMLGALNGKSKSGK